MDKLISGLHTKQEVSICYRRMETPGATPPEMESSDRRFHPPPQDTNKKQKHDECLFVKNGQNDKWHAKHKWREAQNDFLIEVKVVIPIFVFNVNG